MATVADDLLDELVSEDAPDRRVQAASNGQRPVTCSYRSTTNMGPFQVTLSSRSRRTLAQRPKSRTCSPESSRRDQIASDFIARCSVVDSPDMASVSEHGRGDSAPLLKNRITGSCSTSPPIWISRGLPRHSLRRRLPVPLDCTIHPVTRGGVGGGSSAVMCGDISGRVTRLPRRPAPSGVSPPSGALPAHPMNGRMCCGET
jgi:hypothetical protein